MQLGIPTLIETRSLEECALLCKNLGLQFIELNMNLPEYQLDKINTRKFKDIAEKYDIYYTIHLDENLNVCDFNDNVAEAYLNTVLNTIKIAKLLDIPVLNMHMSEGVYFTLPNKKVYLFEEYKKHYLKCLEKFRKSCEKAIGKEDIKICIENTGVYKKFQREGINTLLKSHCFALTYDIGHGYVYKNEDEAFILQHKNKLYHMHIHDANKENNHLILGTGKINLEKYFDLAKEHNCRIVIETKTIDGIKKSKKWIDDKLR